MRVFFYINSQLNINKSLKIWRIFFSSPIIIIFNSLNRNNHVANVIVVCSLNSQGRSVFFCCCLDVVFSKQKTLCDPKVRVDMPLKWVERKKNNCERKKNVFIRVMVNNMYLRILCVCRFLCSDPLTSMKFIRFFHDNHIFHRFSFNKRYSNTYFCFPTEEYCMSDTVWVRQNKNVPKTWQNEKGSEKE